MTKNSGKSFENSILNILEANNEVTTSLLNKLGLDKNTRILKIEKAPETSPNRTLGKVPLKEKIADIVLTVQEDTNIRKLYLSLKDGKSVNLISKGLIRKFGSFDENISQEGIDFLATFGIDAVDFISFFTIQNGKNRDEKINSFKLKSDLKSLLNEYIGNDYFFIHRIENKINVSYLEPNQEVITDVDISRIRYASSEKDSRYIEVFIQTNIGVCKAQFRRTSSKYQLPNACTIWFMK